MNVSERGMVIHADNPVFFNSKLVAHTAKNIELPLGLKRYSFGVFPEVVLRGPMDPDQPVESVIMIKASLLVVFHLGPLTVFSLQCDEDELQAVLASPLFKRTDAGTEQQKLDAFNLLEPELRHCAGIHPGSLSHLREMFEYYAAREKEAQNG